MDAHFGAAFFRYFRSRALELKQWCTVIFMDDKAKVPMGEPGNPVSTGVRGRSSITPSTTVLGALDHDVSTKSSLTSSVPEKLEQSWYLGQVHVFVGEAVFFQATAFRSAAMMVSTVLKSGPFKVVLKSFGGS